MTEFAVNILGKAKKWYSALQDFEGSGDSRLKKCALVYMAVKVFLILLATCSITILFLAPAFQKFVEDTSRMKLLLFTSPVILVVLFKLYFIGMIVLTYERPKHILQLVVRNMLREKDKIVLKLRDAVPSGLRHGYGKFAK